MGTDLDVAVVGAGIAGLAVAHHLRRAGRQVHVFESADHVGGRMRTERRDGWLVDTGAELLATHGYPATWRLIDEVGLTGADAPVIGTGLAVWREGRAHPGVGDPRVAAGLSPTARIALARLAAGVRLRAKRYDPDHPEATPLGAATLADLLRRRHRDLHDYLFAPLAAGFHGWDTALACAGPLFAHLNAVGPISTFRVYRDGMDTLARALAERVDVSTGMAVTSVSTTDTGARLVVDGAELAARQVVLAVPAPVAAALHEDAPAYVRAVPYRPMVKVSCLLDVPVLAPGGGFGLLVPPVENPVFAGALFDERRNPGSVPPGRGAVTLFAAQAATPDLVAGPPERAAEVLLAEARRYLPGLRCRDTAVSVFRHGQPMPTGAALATRGEFVRRAPSAVEHAGDWYALRPSSEGAVRSAEIVAARVLARTPSLAVAGG
ncbi:protoporphyrinogen/coproporphyrinogen oxidase [Actinokineospora soli]|uniref:Protoporphyrinogen/coproporphyrinogen oxidase n=1 Tax=Actinokineospora soli TaxID=1048753 RepID=A0ABW2TUA2_9PSEU